MEYTLERRDSEIENNVPFSREKMGWSGLGKIVYIISNPCSFIAVVIGKGGIEDGL